MTLFPTYLELVLVSLFGEFHALVVNKGVTLPLAIIKARVSTRQMERAREILESIFGYDKFKLAQEEVRGRGLRGNAH